MVAASGVVSVNNAEQRKPNMLNTNDIVVVIAVTAGIYTIVRHHEYVMDKVKPILQFFKDKFCGFYSTLRGCCWLKLRGVDGFDGLLFIGGDQYIWVKAEVREKTPEELIVTISDGINTKAIVGYSYRFRKKKMGGHSVSKVGDQKRTLRINRNT